MSKKNIRKVHIDGYLWKYYVSGTSIVIWAPYGTRRETSLEDLEFENGAITPGVVKKYIQKTFVGMGT